MRKNPTPAEAAFWQAYRQYPSAGRIGIKRQAIILGYIVDFWIPSRRVVIELDGSAHDGRGEYDQHRTDVMTAAIPGLKVVRFANEAILANPQHAMDVIQRRLRAAPVYRSWRSKSPVVGPTESPVTVEANHRQASAQRQPQA